MVLNENNCEYCRCLEGKNTFMKSGDNHGECQRDEHIEPKSGNYYTYILLLAKLYQYNVQML